MSDPGLELRQGRSELSRQGGAGVTEAVDREPWHVDRCLALVVRGPQDAVVQGRVAVASREQQRIPIACGLLVRPDLQSWQQMGRDRDRSDPGVGLGWANQELPLEPYDGLADVDHAGVEVEIAHPEAANLA